MTTRAPCHPWPWHPTRMVQRALQALQHPAHVPGENYSRLAVASSHTATPITATISSHSPAVPIYGQGVMGGVASQSRAATARTRPSAVSQAVRFSIGRLLRGLHRLSGGLAFAPLIRGGAFYGGAV